MDLPALRLELEGLEAEAEKERLRRSPDRNAVLLRRLVEAHYTQQWSQDHILTQPGSYEDKSAALLVAEERLAYDQRGTHEALQATLAAQAEVDEKLQAVLCEVSSDDSDGFDPDHNAEWRDTTRRIFAVSRAVELHHGDTECDDFLVLLRDLRRGLAAGDVAPLTLTEVQMIWDAVRFVRRHGDPVHAKHWLSHSADVVDTGHLQRRVSLINYFHVMHAAADFPALSDRHRRKAQRWLARSMLLFHRRVRRLADYGIEEPTWYQVNVSGIDRKEYVPLSYLWHLVEENTERHKVSAWEYPNLNGQFKLEEDALQVEGYKESLGT
eukprot:EG_transcript_16287